MKEETKFEKIIKIIDELFPNKDIIENIDDNLENKQNKIIRKKKYPKTRKHKKIENLKKQNSKIIESREKTFYENLICSNESCLLINNDSINKNNNIENIILNLEETRIFTTYPPKSLAEGLTSYILYVLIETNPLDLITEKINLKNLNLFLLDLSKYITDDININEEQIKYYIEVLNILKEMKNIAGIESILTGIKNCKLKDKDFDKIIKFEKEFRKNEKEIFLNNKNSLPSIGFLLNKLSSINDSEEFVAIIDYFSELKETIYDENLEYNIFRTVEDFNINIIIKNEEYSLNYFKLIS